MSSFNGLNVQTFLDFMHLTCYLRLKKHVCILQIFYILTDSLCLHNLIYMYVIYSHNCFHGSLLCIANLVPSVKLSISYLRLPDIWQICMTFPQVSWHKWRLNQFTNVITFFNRSSLNAKLLQLLAWHGWQITDI